MKYFLYIFILVGLTSCNGGTSENDSDVLDSIEVVTESEISIDGMWGLTNYFDTIVTHRELAKYRMQPPTWFGILLDIRDNQIISYGSICNDSGFYSLNTDTIRTFETYGGSWWLIKNKTELILCQMPNARIVDSTKYVYRKRDDLTYMTKSINEWGKMEKIEPHVRSFFEKHLFYGEYKIKNGNQIVSFEPDGRIVGLKEYTTYKLDEYFGTYHPFNNNDALFLEVNNSKHYDFWNWKFNGNELVLTQFKVDPKNADDFVVGIEKIILVKN
ncbi:MAG: hypothetical protein K1X55_12995 [Chitinophagales bacterium]|nr:hypothetical protein [Chitinophagales bacterium]